MKKEPEQAWWHAGMTVFGEVIGWIAAPIIAALFLGRYLDEKNDSEPWYFLGLTAAAFIITTIGIIKVAGKYINQIEKEAKKETKSDKTDNK
ncbi:MAG: AtpZ/AtpI family protein [Candidatus Kerfeldbacteria bacterium]